MGFKLASILVVAFVVIAAGCGGGKKKSVSPTPAATTTSTGATTTAATTTTASPTFASTKNCAQLLGLGAKFAQAFGAAGNGKASITDEAKAFEALAAAAPSEIRGDFQTLAGAFSTYAQVFAKAGIKVGQAPTAAQIAQLQTAAKAFSAPKMRAAEQHVSAWGRKNCGGLTTTTTG
jgi:hypothetical protein